MLTELFKSNFKDFRTIASDLLKESKHSMFCSRMGSLLGSGEMKNLKTGKWKKKKETFRAGKDLSDILSNYWQRLLTRVPCIVQIWCLTCYSKQYSFHYIVLFTSSLASSLWSLYIVVTRFLLFIKILGFKPWTSLWSSLSFN